MKKYLGKILSACVIVFLMTITTEGVSEGPLNYGCANNPFFNTGVCIAFPIPGGLGTDYRCDSIEPHQGIRDCYGVYPIPPIFTD